MKLPFEYPREVASTIRSKWAKFRKRSGAHPVPCPSLSSLIQLLDICFFASVKQEEGRRTSFSLCLEPQGGIEISHFRFSHYTRVYSYFPFADPQPLTVPNLVKIAPAFDWRRTSIVVRNEGNHWIMVGYVDETSDKSVTSQDLSILKIQAILPGELSVIAFSKRLCSLRDGRLIKAQAGGLITDSYFHEFFRDISLQLCLEVASIVPDSEGAKAFKRNPSPRLDWAMHYVHVVNKLLLGMADISHGGCILILDRVLEDPLNAPIMGIKPPKYRTKNGELWEMMKGYCILQEQEPEDEPFLNIQTQISEVTNRIDSYVESILKLTGIDGAVVLDRQLAVVAFGAIIDAKELPATVNVQTGQLHNMADFRHVDLKRFGTRHGSAARFAYHTGGMAIVTSHDGGVKMIRRKDEALVILNDASFDLDLEL